MAKLIGSNIAANPGSFNAPIPENFTQQYIAPSASAAPSAAAPTAPVRPPIASFDLNTDPGVLNALALENQGIGQLDAGLKSARERAIINFGDPALASQAGFGLDPQAGSFAQQNYLSGNATLARLDKAHELQRRAVINQLAAHGILNSGDLGYQEGQADQTYGNNVYDAKNAVLDQLANLFSNYLGNRSGYESQTQNARLQAITNFLQNPDAYASQYAPAQAQSSPQSQVAQAITQLLPTINGKKQNYGPVTATRQGF